MPMNQSTDSTSTRPIAGMLGTAFSVAARITMAEPGTPCAPLDVTSDTPSTSSRSPRFVDEGAYVFITGRRQTELDEAVKAIGSEVAGVRGDVSELPDLDRLYETVKAKGKTDILVANAGTGEFAPLASLTEEHFDKLFDLNVKGTLFTVQKALPLMNDGGSIILIGSVASVKGTASFGTYGATKAAVRNLVRTWTVELKDRRIRSNVLSPGPIKTPVCTEN
jgi:NAD(P)-dependent dehydrogenase (short-subunit alcohol dehydrogenase family)